jgi:predicted PurR-regulated permease PerM
VAGSTLFGAFGAVLAVPVSAMIINVIAEARNNDTVEPARSEPAAADP